MRKAACIAVFFYALSSEAAGPTPYFDGVMVGGAIGATAAQFQTSQKIHYDLSGTVSQSQETNLFANTPTVLVSIGYSYQADNAFTVGGYFTAAYSNAQYTDNRPFSVSSPSVALDLETKTTSQFTNDFALLIKGGYVWQRTTHFYGMAGPRWGNFNTQVKTEYLLVEDSVEFSGSEKSSASGYILGYTMGLGVQQLLTERYSWALEYAYTTYGALDTPSTEFVSTGMKPSTNSLIFMIGYRF